MAGDCPGKAQQLALTGRERAAALCYRCSHAIIQFFDKLVSLGQFQSQGDLGIIDLIVAQTDILGNGTGKQEDILLGYPDMFTQRSQLYITDINAINGDTATGNIIKP